MTLVASASNGTLSIVVVTMTLVASASNGTLSNFAVTMALVASASNGTLSNFAATMTLVAPPPPAPSVSSHMFAPSPKKAARALASSPVDAPIRKTMFAFKRLNYNNIHTH